MIKFLFMSLVALCGAAGALEPQPYNPDEIAREFLWGEFRELPAAKRPRVGLALSGGGARAYCHVGVLDALVGAGVPIDRLAGTSMGAVVGAFFCAGLPMPALWDLGRTASFAYASKDYNVIGFLHLVFRQRLLSSDRMEDFISKRIGNITFEQMKIPFSCTAMDIKTGERIVFTEGPVAVAVRASMNLPGFFQPVEYRHRYLVDGGVVDFLPVNCARELGAEWVIASAALNDFSASSLENVLTYLLQVLDIRGAILAEAAMRQADFVLTPAVGDIQVGDFAKSVVAANLGLSETFRQLNPLKEKLIFHSLKNVLEKYEKP